MDDLLNDFLVETAEHIDAADMQLVQFEKNPGDKSIIASIFRLLHTIKGTCGFLGLTRLELLTHAAETLISRMRDGVPASADNVSSILAAIDRVKYILRELETAGSEPRGHDNDLIAILQRQVTAADGGLSGLEAAQDDLTEMPASAAVSPPPTAAHATRKTETIRVTVDTLERIMLLVSELVLTRNQLLDLHRHREEERTNVPLQRLSALTSDLQDTVMRARMQPMGRLFASLPRLVRDLSVELGKKLILLTEGGETELDRQLIELIRDPLTHLVRNCADHGIESPAGRLAAGKPEAGTIQVTASHQAGYITINVSDNGRGLDLARIRSKVLAKGLATAAELAKMSDDEICHFIFVPSFSTMDVVTNISGRGIGMDVVRNNIEEIGGSISLTTMAGKGTRFSMKIPLTLAIAPALIIEAGGHRFALPQHSVVEVISMEDHGRHRIDHVHGALMLQLRDHVLPLKELRALLDLPEAQGPARRGQIAVVMRLGTQSFGILIDEVSDVQEVVVKPLGASLAHLEVFSGHTVLGDGSIVLILDPAGIAAGLGLVQANDYTVLQSAEPTAAAAKSRLLLFRAGPGTLKAIPLSAVAYIEAVAATSIEPFDDMFVMQRKGQLIPLMPVSEMGSGQEHPVLVLGVGAEKAGLIVDEILDIVEENLEVDVTSRTPGIIGSIRIEETAVELIDAMHFLHRAHPNAVAQRSSKPSHVLLVDDKPFFRDMLSPVLSAAGHGVTCAASGSEALALLGKYAFDAVITDIDMPDMSGYALTAALADDPKFAHLPVLGLAAHAAPAIEHLAAAHGMRGVVGKFDRAALLESLSEILARYESGQEAKGQEPKGHDLEGQNPEARRMNGLAA